MINNNEVKTKHQKFYDEFSKDEQKVLRNFFGELSLCLNLPESEKNEIIVDYQRAIRYFYQGGNTFPEIMEKIAIDNIGDFYINPTVKWYPLDNAAKVYPLSITKKWMAMFHLRMHLKDEIVPEVLQLALIYTIKRFPYFATTIREGLFWHYLDVNKKRYIIEEETKTPCNRLDTASTKSQLFHVLYSKNSISVEFFHVLTDGTGGMTFLKTLVAEYLRLLGKNIPFKEQILDINQSSDIAEGANDFLKAEPAKKISGLIEKMALQVDGKRTHNNQHSITYLELDAMMLKNLSQKYQATITTIILAFMFLACKRATSKKKGYFQIQVPVNMRKLYQSKTLRNFSLYCFIKEPANKDFTFEELLIDIKEQIAVKASKDSLNKTMLMSNRLVKISRFFPLVIKTTVAMIVSIVSKNKSMITTTLYNIAVATIPEEMDNQIKKMDFTLGPSLASKINCGLITKGPKTVLAITKSIKETTFESCLRELLVKYDVKILKERNE